MSNTRPDKRYRDPDKAPGIVSEKRLTFFLPHAMFRRLKLAGGNCQVANAKANGNAGDAPELPESPSALARLAIEALFGEADQAVVDAVRKAGKK
jgi:hypothetical protein